MRRSTCSGCGNGDLEPFLDLGLSPVADAYTTTGTETSIEYPLEVVVCRDCRLVQLLEVVAHEVLFGTGYSFYTSASAPLSRYHQRYADEVFRTTDLAGQFVVEVGCNDGDLLRHFANAGAEALGVDPATGPLRAARERGLDTIEAPFGCELAARIRDERGPARLVVANHVLAHVADVSDVLAGIATLMASDGTGIVEVQYLPDLLINNAFDLVYHEHRNFFSLTSLERAVQRHGLNVVAAKLTDRQGGSLRVVLARDKRSSESVDEIRRTERWLESDSAYHGMQGRADRIRTRLCDALGSAVATGQHIAGYGAPAKATTLLNFCEIDSTIIPYVTDTTLAKQGRYIPGTGIEIRPPDAVDVAQVDMFVLFAWNYLSEIIRQHADFGGRWLVPIPVPMVL